MVRPCRLSEVMDGEASAHSPSQQAFRELPDVGPGPGSRGERPHEGRPEESHATDQRTGAAGVLGVLAACGGWKRVGTEDAKAPSEGFSALLNQQALFQKLGRLSAGDPLPFIGSVAQVKGAGDTVLVILGLVAGEPGALVPEGRHRLRREVPGRRHRSSRRPAGR